MRLSTALLTTVMVTSIPLGAQAYNRQFAVNHAWSHVWTPSDYFREYPNDCTNFVSQCMFAGGWQQVGVWWQYQDPNKWFFMPKRSLTPYSYTWTSARHFESFITRSGRGGLVNDWRQLRPGDVIVADWGPGAVAPGSTDGTGDHVMIVVATSPNDLLYAQHSPNKVRTLSSVRSEMWRSRFWYYKIYD